MGCPPPSELFIIVTRLIRIVMIVDGFGYSCWFAGFMKKEGVQIYNSTFSRLKITQQGQHIYAAEKHIR